MSHESVLADLALRAPDLRIITVEQSTATVAEAAIALDVVPGQIAKTLALRVGDQVTRGDTRLDNRKTKAALGGRPRMLDAAETLAGTSHPIGGVCPFGLPAALPISCDESLKAFAVVYPAAGSRNTSVALSPDRLAALVGAAWIDACSLPEPTVG